MDKTMKINSSLIDVELQIKLLEYLKTNNVINEDMYNYVINKLLKNQNI